MDKSDVEMEDAEKKAQDFDNTVAESENNKLESALKPDGTADGLENENGAKAEGEDQNNNSESGVKSPMPAENGDEENKNASVKVEDKSNANGGAEDHTDSKPVVGDFSDARSKVENGASETENQKVENGASETENQSDTRSQPEAQDNAASDDQNGSGVESLDENNAKGDVKDTINGGTDAENELVKTEGDLGADLAVKSEGATGDAAKNDAGGDNVQLPDVPPPTEVGESDKGEEEEVHQNEKNISEVHQNGNDMMVDEQKEAAQDGENPATVINDADVGLHKLPKERDEVCDTAVAEPEPVTPNVPVKSIIAKSGEHNREPSNRVFDEAKMADDEDEEEDEYEDEEGSPEDQVAFMRELESFYRERAMEFKPPKFYGHQLNCLKLWRSVIRLGGYDRVTGSKLWRQVGESFNPPKTCTTVSWTFRIFYEKALLEYERHKSQSGELQFPVAALPDSSGVDNEGNGCQASGSGRARRDSAARAMQGWHAQRNSGYGDVGEPVVKDKNANNMPKREKNLKSIGSLKQKRPNEVEHSMKVARIETSKQLVTTVVDVGTPADWVKINVRETKDSFEVYALVPGLLREEVRVQSDPAGRLVITGQPEQLDNPWGITPFKKVVSLPARIDPLQTSAVVSLHGRLFVRVPFAK